MLFKTLSVVKKGIVSALIFVENLASEKSGQKFLLEKSLGKKISL